MRRAYYILGLVLAWTYVHAQDKVIGEVFTSDASVRGSVTLASGGMQIASGSTVTSGSATTVVKLSRGGEVRLCSGTAMTLNASPKGNGLLLSMDNGDVELHFALRSSADTLVTPDFRITLAGPGEFHVALGADRRGNTCIRTLRGNNSSLLVNEVFGDGVYQVRPDEHINFHGGKVSDATNDAEPCGCPAPSQNLLAENTPPPQPIAPPATASQAEARPAEPAKTSSPNTSAPVSPEDAPAASSATPSASPASDPNRPVSNLTVETPFVFNAVTVPGAPPKELPGVVPLPKKYWVDVPASTYLKQDGRVIDELPQYSVLQASIEEGARPKPQKKGFFNRLRSFFASVFK